MPVTKRKTISKGKKKETEMVAVFPYRITYRSGRSTKVLQGKYLGSYLGDAQISLRPLAGTTAIAKDSIISFELLKENKPMLPKVVKFQKRG